MESIINDQEAPQPEIATADGLITIDGAKCAPMRFDEFYILCEDFNRRSVDTNDVHHRVMVKNFKVTEVGNRLGELVGESSQLQRVRFTEVDFSDIIPID